MLLVTRRSIEKFLKGKVKEKAGETLVEVMASIFLFLILLAILNGAVSYCSSSLAKNKEIRSENTKILEGLQSATETTSGSLEMKFIATNADMTVKGNQVFTVTVDLAKKKVDYTDSDGNNQTTSFSLFQYKGDASGDGGGS